MQPRHPPGLHPCRLCHALGRWGGFAASMTPVTEPLWVLEGLPGEAGAPLLLLPLITPDWVKACGSQTLSRKTGKLDVTSATCGPSGNRAFPSRRAVFALVSYICTCACICAHFFLFPASYCALSWRDSFACSVGRPADGAPRELATLLAMPFLISPFPAVVGLFSDCPLLQFST